MQTKPTSLKLQIFLLTIMRGMMNINTRMVYPFLMVFARGLGVDLKTISGTLTIRAVFGMLTPFLAPLAEKHSRRAGMLLGMAMFALGSGLVVLWPSLITFAIAMSITFLGMYVYMSAVQAYLGDHVPYAQRGRAMGTFELAWSFSFIVGMPLLGFLIGRYGWQAPFPILAIFGLIALIIIRVFIPNSLPEGNGQGSQRLSSLKNVLAAPAARASLLLIFTFLLGNEMINLMFGVWLEDTFALKITGLGAASIILGLADLSGEGLSTVIIDKLGKERTIRIALAASAAASLSMPFARNSLALTLAALFLIYLSFEVAFISMMTLSSEIMPKARATLMASNVAAVSLGRGVGAIISPMLYGVGFIANAGAAVLFAAIAFWLVSKVKVKEQPLPHL
jgi:predicted MFS family arabinose efflux permease